MSKALKVRTCGKCSSKYKPYGQGIALCKPCKREYDRAYHKNRSKKQLEHKKNAQRARVQVARQFIYNYKKEKSCVYCGQNEIATLHFDHIDPNTKEYNISDMVTRGFATEKIVDEISKCQILCANCHQIKTSKEELWYSDLIT